MTKDLKVKIVKSDVKKSSIIEESSLVTFKNADSNNKENSLKKEINSDVLEVVQELENMEKGLGNYESFTSIESLLEDLHK